MGRKVNQSVIIIVILVITSIWVYRTPVSVDVKKELLLKSVLGPVKGYKIIQRNDLDAAINKSLELDDYTFIEYSKGKSKVGLYIGYYNSLDKISAAHSPLICFPSQGWVIEQPLEKSIVVGNHTIHYGEMVATLEERKHLILYWYQSYGNTSMNVYMNKINAVINKITKNKPENAFVRVSVPFTDSSREEEARQEAIEFIKAFYPTFLTYVDGETFSQ